MDTPARSECGDAEAKALEWTLQTHGGARALLCPGTLLCSQRPGQTQGLARCQLVA